MNTIDARAFFSSSAIDDPAGLYARMRARAPVCAIGDTRAFLVATHAAVEEAVKRHEEFSANLTAMLVCKQDESPHVFNLADAGTTNDVMATADEPAHAIHRRLMLPPLKASRIAGMESSVRAFAREGVGALVRNGGGDVCATLAEPLPAFVVMRLLGLADDALDAVRRWAMIGGDLLGGRLEPERLDHLLAETHSQHAFLSAHFDAIYALARGERGDSLTATLAGGVEDGLITHGQAVGILVILFGAAGESTSSLLGSAVRLLAMNRPFQERLRSEPALIPRFIEEAVRLETPFKFHYRGVRAQTTLCGTSLEKGDLLLLGWGAANRDPRVWECPDELRLDRQSVDRHLGFGYGIHFCIGAPLARLEVRVALEELLAETRHVELDPAHPFAYVPSIFVRRLQHLHLRVTAAGCPASPRVVLNG